jgi:hypothetical protein
VFQVHRLAAGAHGYTVVVLDSPEGSVGVAAFDDRGAPTTSARLPGREKHMPFTESEVRRLAGLGEDAKVRLVWEPSAQSRSPLYPVWEVRGPGRTMYVDQHGRIWERMEPAGPGGHPSR